MAAKYCWAQSSCHTSTPPACLIRLAPPAPQRVHRRPPDAGPSTSKPLGPPPPLPEIGVIAVTAVTSLILLTCFCTPETSQGVTGSEGNVTSELWPAGDASGDGTCEACDVSEASTNPHETGFVMLVTPV